MREREEEEEGDERGPPPREPPESSTASRRHGVAVVVLHRERDGDESGSGRSSRSFVVSSPRGRRCAREKDKAPIVNGLRPTRVHGVRGGGAVIFVKSQRVGIKSLPYIGNDMYL
jgi:hypothetical protein